MVQVAQVPGYVFESESAGQCCFVPRELVRFAENGEAQIDGVKFLQSGWALRNMRCAAPEVTGTHLFPDAGRPVRDVETEAVREFLAGLRACTAHPFAEPALR